jgi:hypothetical protein
MGTAQVKFVVDCAMDGDVTGYESRLTAQFRGGAVIGWIQNSIVRT